MLIIDEALEFNDGIATTSNRITVTDYRSRKVAPRPMPFFPAWLDDWNSPEDSAYDK